MAKNRGDLEGGRAGLGEVGAAAMAKVVNAQVLNLGGFLGAIP